MIKLAHELGVTNISFLDPVKKSAIENYLSILDIALVPLKKSPTFASVIPSKIFESVAMNIPILLGVDGESKGIIEFYNSGMYFEPENESDFIEKLTEMKFKILTNKNYFVEGCQKMANDFDRKKLAKNMLDLLS